MWPVVSGAIGGFLAWIATTILGQPIYHFINLRREVAEALARFDEDDPRRDDPEHEPPTGAWLKGRSDAYEIVSRDVV